MKKFNILVFPCGSEIGLEIYRSLRYSSHVNLYGASSVNDHGRFVYENYIGNLPFIDSNEIISELKMVVNKYQIDAIYPAMDTVVWKLKTNENELGCRVVASAADTTEICLSKLKTYEKLKEKIAVPKVYTDGAEISNFPVFIKPVVGYGTRDVLKANNPAEVNSFFVQRQRKDYLVMEYLPFEEFTVDCFTNRNRELLFIGPRQRKRIMNGISVNTCPVKEGLEKFTEIASILNNTIEFRGAWFFQVKLNGDGRLTLLEIASRLGGASALYRGTGVNFALLSIFDSFNIDVKVMTNNYDIELDKALENRYKINIQYSTVYLDLDDCLIINGKINCELLSFLYHAINNKKEIILLTKHEGDLNRVLREHRITSLFDKIIHLSKSDKKHMYIDTKDGVFIDDSFAEREEVWEKTGIHVFSPDMVEVLSCT
jgi:hypothetical protein